MPEHHVLQRRETFEPDRAARVQLVVRDADLRAEPELEAVREARRRVHHHTRRIDFAQEAHRAVVILGDDRIGVMRAVLVDVFDRGVDAVDDLDREHRREIFGAPVFVGRVDERTDARRLEHRARVGVDAQLDTLLAIQPAERRQHRGRDPARDEQRLHRVAGAVAMRLRVVADGERLRHARAIVDIHVADAVEVLDHRHARLVDQPLDQALAAARHDHVDVFGHRDQLADRRPIGRADDLHRVLRQPRRRQPFADQLRERGVRFERLRAAAQDRRVAGLQAQRGRVDRHVRPRFVDDPDHAERHAHLADLDSARAIFEIAHLADRVRQRRDLAQPFDHRLQRLVRQRQAIDERRVVPLVLRARDVARVGGLQRVCVAPDCPRDRFERGVLRRGGRACDLARGAPRAAADVRHVLVDIHRETRNASRVERRKNDCRKTGAPGAACALAAVPPVHADCKCKRRRESPLRRAGAARRRLARPRARRSSRAGTGRPTDRAAARRAPRRATRPTTP
ncbi:hypothetical protein BURPS1710b_3448 [Burkholderia pseudomallei 1710b]|uniref:Uncharacterized protein n=1 Tax=Burkholderia pseudomallei (strain 1710b) TaxID=320372 RepID=Q3JNN4_BURP1|nr:hypothetical protein BURPS1710b_3448 [Burkholderia pseudomallei 1710b]